MLSSVAMMTQVKEVMAFLVAMKLATSHIGNDHFGGFEYTGPDIDQRERERLYSIHKSEFGLIDVSVTSIKQNANVTKANSTQGARDGDSANQYVQTSLSFHFFTKSVVIFLL